MISNEQIPLTLQSVDDLISTLSVGERTKFNNIIRSLELPSSAFESYCSWSNESYTRNCIFDNEKYELILLCWEKGQVTPIHDHGGEECWVKIIEGEFRETIYKKDATGELKMVKSDIARVNDVTYMIDFMGFHQLENLSEKKYVSSPLRKTNS